MERFSGCEKHRAGRNETEACTRERFGTLPQSREEIIEMINRFFLYGVGIIAFGMSGIAPVWGRFSGYSGRMLVDKIFPALIGLFTRRTVGLVEVAQGSGQSVGCIELG